MAGLVAAPAWSEHHGGGTPSPLWQVLREELESLLRLIFKMWEARRRRDPADANGSRRSFVPCPCVELTRAAQPCLLAARRVSSSCAPSQTCWPSARARPCGLRRPRRRLPPPSRSWPKSCALRNRAPPRRRGCCRSKRSSSLRGPSAPPTPSPSGVCSTQRRSRATAALLAGRTRPRRRTPRTSLVRGGAGPARSTAMLRGQHVRAPRSCVLVRCALRREGGCHRHAGTVGEQGRGRRLRARRWRHSHLQGTRAAATATAATAVALTDTGGRVRRR
jgi:hypothetical protein